MGTLVVEAIGHAGASFAGGTSRGTPLSADAISVVPLSIIELAICSDVVIDFTAPAAIPCHASALVDAGAGWVLGTTGLTEADQVLVAQASRQIPVFQAANFSPGAAAAAALVERLAAGLPAEAYDAEILEMHHRHKADAPSGTALALGEAVARGRGQNLAVLRAPAREGRTGARMPGSIGFAALRGGAVVGEHSVIFAGEYEQVIVTHRALDRRVFAEGAVRAALWLGGRSPGLYGIADMMDGPAAAGGVTREPP